MLSRESLKLQKLLAGGACGERLSLLILFPRGLRCTPPNRFKKHCSKESL